MSSHPFTDAHAIANLDFVLVFSEELSKEQQSSLGNALASHLPEFQRAEQERNEELVIEFSLKDAAGDVTEELHIHGNYAHVVWSDYRGWTFSRDTALRYFQPLLERVRIGDLSLAFIGLAYRDVFINPEPETYRAEEVLRRGNAYLPARVFSAGKKWRTWIGWTDTNFEDAALDIQSALRVDANSRSLSEDSGKAHCTEILHRQQIFWNDSAALTNISDDDLRNAWDRGHRRNQQVVEELLVDEMLEKIGLKEGSQ